MNEPFNTRRFQAGDAEKVSALIVHTLKTTNAKDYSAEYIERIAKKFSPFSVIERAEQTHLYVICQGESIVGCGAIGPHFDRADECGLFNIFVLPECQGQGIGKMIMEALEHDDLYSNAKRIEIAASITACEFYRKLGYTYKNADKSLDENQLFRLEKLRGDHDGAYACRSIR